MTMSTDHSGADAMESYASGEGKGRVVFGIDGSARATRWSTG